MIHSDQHTTSRDYSFGNGFDFVMASPDYRPFQTWWNRYSFFPVHKDEAEALLSHPEYRDAA